MIPGFKFCPSDRVLLSYYLLKKLKGQPTKFGIPEVDVYGVEPWRLFRKQINFDDSDDEDDDDEAIHSNNVMYVFTENKKKHGSGERVDRTVISNNQVIGTWKGQTTQTEIRNRISKKIVGVKKMFSFTPVPPPKQDHDEGRNDKNRKRRITATDNDQLDGISYIMHEYSMAGICYVLCRIRRKIDKMKKRKLNPVTNTSVVPYNDQRSMRQQQQQPAVQSAAAVPGGLPDDDLHNVLMNNFR